MENEVKKYEIISNISSKLVIGKTFIFCFLFSIVVYLNINIDLSKIWNLCFLFPLLIQFFACISLHIVLNFRIGGYDSYNIENKNKHKSNLLLASNIVFLVSLFTSFMYFLMSIVLFG